MKAAMMPLTFGELSATHYHMLLGCIDDEIYVFGLKSAIDFLSSTPLIQCDGTFKCVPQGFSQLYVFHAIVNNISYTQMYVLTKRMTSETYQKAFDLVETVAERNGSTFSHRSLDVIIDFERAAKKDLKT